MNRAYKATLRQRKQDNYADQLRLNIQRNPGSHSEFVEKMMKRNPGDRGIILAAERRVFGEMRG
jgi:hypothetical protein